MRLARSTPRHTKGELNEVAAKAKTGDARAALLLAEMMRPYIVSFLRKAFRGGDYSRDQQDEMESAAYLGIWEALDRWEVGRTYEKGGESKEVKFSTYALHWTRHEVNEWKAKNSRALPIPRKAWHHAKKLEEAYLEANGEDADIYKATDAELASIELAVVRDGEETTLSVPSAGDIFRGRRGPLSFDPTLLPSSQFSPSAESTFFDAEDYKEAESVLAIADRIGSEAEEIPTSGGRLLFVVSEVERLGWPPEAAKIILERENL